MFNGSSIAFVGRNALCFFCVFAYAASRKFLMFYIFIRASWHYQLIWKNADSKAKCICNGKIQKG